MNIARLKSPAVNLPELPPLQFAVIRIIGGKSVSGPQLQKSLSKLVQHSDPAFYQLMARMIRDGLLECRNTVLLFDPPIRANVYRTTTKAQLSAQKDIKFYNSPFNL